MKEHIIKTYSFKELPKEVQEQLIASYPEDFDYPTEQYYLDINEEWTEKLEALGFNAEEFAFTGFWSQGDGGSFIGTVDVKKWIEVNDEAKKYDKVHDLLDMESIEVDDATIKRDRWIHYVHWNTTSLYLSFIFHNVSEEEKESVCSLLDDLEKDIFKHHQQLNNDYYAAVKEAYEYEVADKTIRSILEDDTDTEYFINGNVYTEAYGSENSE